MLFPHLLSHAYVSPLRLTNRRIEAETGTQPASTYLRGARKWLSGNMQAKWTLIQGASDGRTAEYGQSLVTLA